MNEDHGLQNQDNSFVNVNEDHAFVNEEYRDGDYNSDETMVEEDSTNDNVLNQDKRQARAEAKKRRIMRTQNNKRGEWFLDAATEIPDYDISKPPPFITLQSAQWGNDIRAIGQEFKRGIVEYRQELVKYASKLGFHFKFVRNDARYCHAYCKLKQEDGCNWFVHANLSSLTRTTFIKQANLTHTCKL